MKETFASRATKTSLLITPRDLGINELSNYSVKEPSKLYKIFTFLVMQTPTQQSHLGNKWSSFTKLNNNTLNDFTQKLVKGLDVKEIFIFSVMESKRKDLNNVRDEVLKSNSTMLCLHIGDGGLKNALYASVRNALAHGNIIDNGNHICLYSVSSKNKDYGSEYDTPLTFYLRIYNIGKLEAYITTLDEYK